MIYVHCDCQERGAWVLDWIGWTGWILDSILFFCFFWGGFFYLVFFYYLYYIFYFGSETRFVSISIYI